MHSIDTQRQGDAPNHHRDVVERVIVHMKGNLTSWTDELSLSELGRIGGFSRSHMICVFESLTGTTPHHFLTSLRIQRAKELLFETDLSIGQVAMEVGYRSIPTFSRTFVAYVGLTPSGFRALPSEMSAEEAFSLLNIMRQRMKTDSKSLTVAVNGQTSRGIVFVGTFIRGVPQGRPYSGAILTSEPSCLLQKPPQREFHVMAAEVEFEDMLRPHTIVPKLVASAKLGPSNSDFLELSLRPLQWTDPPLVTTLRGILG